MAIFEKALGNGYPISAVIERKNYEFCSRTFISSTMWTERLGFIAGVTTLKKIKD